MNPRTALNRISLSISPFTWIISLLIAIHFSLIAAFPANAQVPSLSGGVQLVCAITAAIMCFHASSRKDYSERFWFLLGGMPALWSTAQALYLLNSYYFHSASLLPNVLLFLFFVSTLPLSIAVLGRTHDHEDTHQWLHWFDGAQVVGLILAACLLNFDLATGKNGLPQIELRLMTVHVRNLIIAIALLVRTMVSRGKTRQLYAPICFAFSVFAMSSWFGNQALEMWGAKNGQWWDLCWSVPFAVIAVAAAQWSHSASQAGIPATQVLECPAGTAVGRQLTEFLYPFLLSISLVGLSLKGMETQPRIAVALVLASCLIFSARSSFLQCHRAKLLVEIRRILDNTKRLTGYLPLCAACKMIRNESGEWQQLEGYIRECTDAEFTHGICPDCICRLYPEHSKVT